MPSKYTVGRHQSTVAYRKKMLHTLPQRAVCVGPCIESRKCPVDTAVSSSQKTVRSGIWQRHPVAASVLLLLLTPGLGDVRSATATAQEESLRNGELERVFDTTVLPLVKRYCYECHSADRTEAEIDFSKIRSFRDNRTHVAVWLSVRDVLSQRQMPPDESDQPTEADRDALLSWTRSYLRSVASAADGDPGAVELRRLTNAEYNYVLQDLTGISDLNLTREFPVDGAAGEGFTNTGSGQALSPSMINRYLKAAREMSSHLVLLPDGIRFSKFTTRRDHTDEILNQLRSFYGMYTESSGGSSVDIQGIPLETNTGGRLPIARYLKALLQWRDSAARSDETLEQLAAEQNLSVKYLAMLAEALVTHEVAASDQWSPLSELRRQFANAGTDDLSGLVRFVRKLQDQLWSFNTIGHIGRAGGPERWMERRSPMTARQEVRLSLPGKMRTDAASIWFSAAGLLPSTRPVSVLWHQPRLEYADEPGRASVLLKDVAMLSHRVIPMTERELARTQDYLEVAADLYSGRLNPADVDNLVSKLQLDRELLNRWMRLAGMTPDQPMSVTGHFTEQLTQLHGNPQVNGWGSEGTPSLLTNASGEAVSFLTLTIPSHGVTVHPSPDEGVFVTWRSPVSGTVELTVRIADADGNCGNGVRWQLNVTRPQGSVIVGEGAIDNGGTATTQPTIVAIKEDELITLRVMARDHNHVCDTTEIGLTIQKAGNPAQIWDLSRDLVGSILSGNPLPDSYGNSGVWHFGRHSVADTEPELIPTESCLGQWRSALRDNASPDQLRDLALQVQLLFTGPAQDDVTLPDRQLKELLLDWHGPLQWLDIATEATHPDNTDLRSVRFGEGLNGRDIAPASFVTNSAAPVQFTIPQQLIANAEVVADAEILSAGAGGVVTQPRITTEPPTSHKFDPAAPFLIVPESMSARRLEDDLEAFRHLFPAALCYRRIVPVDEAVTLNLYFREDEHLQRLMLSQSEAATLDRLWDELLYVSQEPFQLAVSFEQISEFATQDRPDLVKAFAPLRQPITQRAKEFQRTLEASEPTHLRAVEAFTVRAWRIAETEFDARPLRQLYQELRRTGFDHESALRRLVTRALMSPTFLFRLEDTPAGVKSDYISSHELASRLSFFLWSTLPDAELRNAADKGKLVVDLESQPSAQGEGTPAELILQTRRMLQDHRCRRLAEQFACQWLHIRDFDQQNDKNERLYPQFASLRGAMYEETVQFFDDLIRNDGSVLEILSAEHSFLNERLADHYQIPGVEGASLRRVEGIDQWGRGGILGMATVLASQSGASRTSPILRGNWISETLLGERLPRPPANVPQLPDALPKGLTSRQLIERHSALPECAHCHEKIDAYGFALEQFDTIGRTRTEEADTAAVLPDGTQVRGLPGLKDYLVNVRRDAFLQQFCRKLLGYALGRAVQLSDEPLIDDMQRQLAASDYRFSSAVETIVLSRQFRMIRGSDWPELPDHH